MADFAPQYDLFKIIERFRNALKIMFWFVFTFSIIPVIVKNYNIKVDCDDIINSANIIVIGMSFFIELFVEFILVPKADSKRRDDFIDNCFGSKFSPNSSVGYYSNGNVKGGIYRVAVNLFENCFFTYNLVKSITVKKVITPLIIMFTVGICAYYGFKQVPFGLSLLQVLFTMNLLGDLQMKRFLYVTLISKK